MFFFALFHQLALVFDVPAGQVKAGDWIGLFDSGVTTIFLFCSSTCSLGRKQTIDADARSYLTYWKTGDVFGASHVKRRDERR